MKHIASGLKQSWITVVYYFLKSLKDSDKPRQKLLCDLEFMKKKLKMCWGHAIWSLKFTHYLDFLEKKSEKEDHHFLNTNFFVYFYQ